MRAMLLGLLFLSPAPVRGAEFVIDAGKGHVIVHVGRSGLLGFAGHVHEVEGAPVRGEIVADKDNLSASSVVVAFSAADFHLIAGKESPDDIPKIETTMRQDVLESTQHPEITFTSTSVRGEVRSPGHYALTIKGTLSLHGIDKPVTVSVAVETDGKTLTAQGGMSITHGQFAMRRASGGGGTVKVADELPIDFTLVAHSRSEGESR
jgi:polyisoprenoid-binding protein YceI